MPLYEMTGSALAKVESTSFTELGMTERADLQSAIAASVQSITPGIRTMVLADEYGAWVGVNRRIDLLCLDEDGRLVVVELKREGSTHMELQAIRYAAMVAPMLFEHAVQAHQKYLAKLGRTDSAAEAITAFLGGSPEQFNSGVRIVLAAASFSPEVTTTVLWLNSHGLDIRCVQLRPHKVDNRVLVDIQQVIPLPEAASYQVALREKAQEQEQAKARSRINALHDLTIADETYPGITSQRLLYLIVAEAIRRGMAPEDIAGVIKDGDAFLCCLDDDETDSALSRIQHQPDSARYLIEQPFNHDGKIYAFREDWDGNEAIQMAGALVGAMPEGPTIAYETSALRSQEVAATAQYDGYTITKFKGGFIEVRRGDTPIAPYTATLREIASSLGVEVADANSRGIGSRVIDALNNRSSQR